MADIQLENGFTKIANQILEVIQHFQFTQNQFKVLMLLWRNTYGWNRKECELSLSYIEKATHLDRKRASTTLQDLIKANVLIEINKGSSTKAKVVGFNKNYTEWTINQYKGSGILSTSGHSATSGNEATSGSGELTTSGSGHSATHKRNIKEILNKDIAADKESTGGVPTTEIVQLADANQSKGQIPGSSLKNDYQLIKELYMRLAGIGGFDLNAKDDQGIHTLLNYKIDVNKVLVWLEECFRDYKPKHKFDKINSFAYCLPMILDKHVAESEGGNNDKKIHQYRPSNGRFRNQGKTADQIFRELEESKRAWGG